MIMGRAAVRRDNPDGTGTRGPGAKAGSAQVNGNTQVNGNALPGALSPAARR